MKGGSYERHPVSWRYERVMWLCFVGGTCFQCANHEPLNSVGSGGTSARPVVSAFVADSSRGDFEPEEGNFGLSRPDPYEIRLHEALFAEDDYRVCQLVTVPSFKAESAVYITVHEPGPPLVVSRTLNEQLWGLMMATIGVQLGDRKSIGTGPAAQAAALAKIHASSDTDRAEIDQATVDILSRACESVLMRASYHGPTNGVDGTTYHAGNWKPGVFVAGRVWSPESGTIAKDYIALAESLRAYAVSAPSGRGAIKGELLAKAERLLARAIIKR
jgi:hypothetical protein